MATVDDQIAALEEAIATGAKKVTFRSGGTLREVEYRSLSDMNQALASLKAKSKPRRRVTLASM